MAQIARVSKINTVYIPAEVRKDLNINVGDIITFEKDYATSRWFINKLNLENVRA